MNVEVLLFASLADRAGARRRTVTVEPGTTVESLWATLCVECPALGSIGARPMVACDREYARWDRALDGVREVAFLPPVSGG